MKKIAFFIVHPCIYFLLFLTVQGQPAFAQVKNDSIEMKLRKAGSVDVQILDPSIRVKLMYSQEKNFIGRDVYGDLEKCYLQKEVALKLVDAQKRLKVVKPGYALLVFDGARPRSVQYRMWAIVQGTAQQGYVANPQYGSMHNYGVAVDLGIADENGRELDMGTPFDFLGDLAKPALEEKFLKQGKLTKTQVANRRLLRTVMLAAGLKMISNEWWHFEGFSRNTTKEKYQIIE